MDFGIYVNQYGVEQSEFGFSDMFDQLNLMEKVGFDSIGVGEVHFYDQGFYDPLSCMTAFAAQTESLKVFSNILIPAVYNPIHLAERIVALDHLTKGNAEFGVAIGDREKELKNFGVDMDERVPRFLEVLEVTKRLLEGERFDYYGEYFQFDDVFVRPEPVQDPRPPIWGGGSVESAIKRAAYRCDGFAPNNPTPEVLKEHINVYRNALEEAGKNPRNATINVMVDGYVADTIEEARDALTPNILDLYEQYNRWQNPETPDPRPSWEDIRPRLLVGAPDDIIEQIETYQELGVDHVILRTQFEGMNQGVVLENIRLMGEEVIPEFQ